MKMPLTVFVTLGWLSIGGDCAQARIGETEKQCGERYGKPTSRNEKESHLTYKKGGMTLTAHFHEGKCDYIVFEKDEPGARLSENERNLLLKANGAGREWGAPSIEGEQIIIKTTDGDLEARYAAFDPGFWILTREALKRIGEARKAEEEKKLKGF